jgi:hypothetical protein
MSKPPAATPHSDIDGVHKDEKRNVDSANASGQTSEDLAKAHREAAARPYYAEEESEDDRSS